MEKINSNNNATDKWTAKEILPRVIDWERILSYRAMLFARREGSIPQSIDHDQLAANLNAKQRLIESLIAELSAVRLSTKALFDSFDEDTLHGKGTNWKYEISISALGFAIVGHQIHQLKIIETHYISLALK